MVFYLQDQAREACCRVRRCMSIIASGQVVVPLASCMGPDGVCLAVTRQGTRRRQCPLHGVRVRSGVHWETCRDVVRILYQEHAQVAVLTEFCVTRKYRSVTKIVHKVDVLAVFSNGRCLAVEVDGPSHDSTVCVGMDARKELLLCQHRIDVFRVDIRVHSQICFELDHLRQYVRSIIL